MKGRDAIIDDPTPTSDGAEPSPSAWQSGARWLLQHPLHVATVLALAFGLAHRYDVLPWRPDRGTMLAIVLVIYGLAVVLWKWIEEERGFRTERRNSAAD